MSIFKDIDYGLFLDFASLQDFDYFNFFIYREVVTTYKLTDGALSFYSTPSSYLRLAYLKDDYHDLLTVDCYSISYLDLYQNLKNDFKLERDYFPPSFYSKIPNLKLRENTLNKEFNYYKEIVDLLHDKLKNHNNILNFNLTFSYKRKFYNLFSTSFNNSSYFVLPLLNIELILVDQGEIRAYYDEFNLDDFNVSTFLLDLDNIISSRFNLTKFKSGIYNILFTNKAFATLLSASNIFFNSNITFKSLPRLNIKHIPKISTLDPNFNILEEFDLVKDGKFINTANSYFLRNAPLTNQSLEFSCNLFVEPGKNCNIDFKDGLVVQEIDIKHDKNWLLEPELTLCCYGTHLVDGISKSVYFYIHTTFKELFTNIISIGDDLAEFVFDIDYYSTMFVSTPSILVSHLKVYNSYDFSSMDIDN